MVGWTAIFPYASITFGPFLTWYIWWLYTLGGVWWWHRNQRRETKSIKMALPEGPGLFSNRNAWVWGGSLLIALLPWWIITQQPDGRLHLYMLDIGQGDAILIVAPDGKQILIDGGGNPVGLLTRLGDRMAAKVVCIELVVLTHADADHLGGLPELLNRYQVAHSWILDLSTRPPFTGLGESN